MHVKSLFFIFKSTLFDASIFLEYVDNLDVLDASYHKHLQLIRIVSLNCELQVVFVDNMNQKFLETFHEQINYFCNNC